MVFSKKMKIVIVLESMQVQDCYSLLLLSQAVFWTMAYILSHPEVYATVKRDVDTALPLSSEGRLGAVSEEALKKLASVKRCMGKCVTAYY